jgi:ABC-type glycerol-3-phosphate transport system substrate-binding protein
MRRKLNKKSILVLTGLLLLFPSAFFIFPTSVIAQPETSASGVILNIVVTTEQQPGVTGVIPAFLASPLGSGIDGVNVLSSGTTSDDQLVFVSARLAAQSSSIDVVGMDVIWTAQFVDNGWLVNLDSYLDTGEMDDYVGGMVDSATYQGSVWAYPYFLDMGVMYYRTDLLNDTFGEGMWDITDFDTWAELNDTANAVLLHENDPNLFGYIAQLSAYEGGTVNFQEWIGSNGAKDIFNPDGTPNVTQPKMIEALTFLKGLIPPDGVTDLINTPYIIPRDALTYNEGTTHTAWLAGHALFVRNWPYMYALTLASPYNESFGVMAIPTFHGTPDEKSSCVGGQILGISTYSANKAAAFNLTRFLCDNYSQYYALQTLGHFPTLKETYSSLPPGYDYVYDFYLASGSTLARPKNSQYSLISNKINQRFVEIISCQATAAAGLQSLQGDIEDILAPVPEVQIPGFQVGLLIVSMISVISIIVLTKRKKK